MRKNPHVDQENAARADPAREIPSRRAAQYVPSPPQSVWSHQADDVRRLGASATDSRIT